MQTLALMHWATPASWKPLVKMHVASDGWGCPKVQMSVNSFYNRNRLNMVCIFLFFLAFVVLQGFISESIFVWMFPVIFFIFSFSPLLACFYGLLFYLKHVFLYHGQQRKSCFSNISTFTLMMINMHALLACLTCMHRHTCAITWHVMRIQISEPK